jgi:transposase-like protein
MTRAKQPKRIHQMTIPEWEAAFPDEDACCGYLVRYRWRTGIMCPRCGNTEIAEHGTMPWCWLCNKCSPPATNYRFSHIVGTVFENTNKPLRDWFRVIHLMLTSKKGVSALQIHRMMGFGSYKTAWYMCHRIRAALANEEFHKLMGIVEVDETYIGGKSHNRHGPRDPSDKGRSTRRKSVVVGAVERKGSVVARVIDRVTIRTLNHFITETISHKVSLVATDDYPGYNAIPKQFPHDSVTHSAGLYVHGNIHTNTIEGFWSLVKRGVVGTYHKVSRKYLPLYIAEFQFRYNNRNNPNIFGEAIKGC